MTKAKAVPVRLAQAAAVLLAMGMTLTGCMPQHEKRKARMVYVVGPPWRSGGVWFYPAPEATYEATGLAVVSKTQPGRRFTSDGERVDPHSLTAAHQTLPLPAIIEVINLQNGRMLVVRLNDRGPATASRLIEVTPAVASLLGMRTEEPARVRIVLDTGRTSLLLRAVAGAPPPDITAAPLQPVDERPLDGSATRANSGNTVGRQDAATQQNQPDGIVRQAVAEPGQLWVEVGQFSERSTALQVARQVGAELMMDRQAALAYDVRSGPYNTVLQADDALDRVHAAGLTGARIIVR